MRETLNSNKAAQATATEKANNLIEWLESKKLTEPIVMAAHMTIEDPGLMISSHKQILQNAPVLSENWKIHYMRLYHLKQKLERNEKSI